MKLKEMSLEYEAKMRAFEAKLWASKVNENPESLTCQERERAIVHGDYLLHTADNPYWAYRIF